MIGVGARLVASQRPCLASAFVLWGMGKSPERGPFCREPRETICKLDARTWPRCGRFDLLEPDVPEGCPSLVLADPMETMEMDRRWPLLEALFSEGDWGGGHGVESARWRLLDEGTLRERLERCPRDGGGAKPAVGLTRAELRRSELGWRDC